MIVALLFTLHLVAINAVTGRMAEMNLYSFLVVGFVELALMFIVVFLAGRIRNDS